MGLFLFEGEFNFDYLYCPENISISKSEIKQSFYNWIDYTKEDHPFWHYENGQLMGLCYRGDAIVYWINKYILNDKDNTDKARILESFTSKNLNYNLEIRL